MLPYGLDRSDYGNDSKKAGDLYGLRGSPYMPRQKVMSSDSIRRELRVYKKRARRSAKQEIVERIMNEM